MRVIFYYNFLGLGGVEASLLGRVAALRQLGVNGEYWFSQFYGDGARYLADHEFVSQVDLNDESPLNEIDRSDVVVVVDFPRLVETLQARRSPTPLIYETHASFPPALERFYGVMGNPQIAAIVVPSAFNKRMIMELTSPQFEPIVIRNCFHPSFLKIDCDAAPPDLTENGPPLVLWVGRMEEEKNPQDLVRIAAELARTRPDIHFLVVGDSHNYEEYLSRLRAEHGPVLPASIHLVRSVGFDAMPALFRRVAASGGFLVSTSSYESAPMTFIEAMVCGCPVISSDVGGVRELIEHGVSGFLYEPGEIQSVVHLLEAQCSATNHPLRESVVLRAHQRALENHLPHTIARQYDALLRKLIGDF